MGTENRKGPLKDVKVLDLRLHLQVYMWHGSLQIWELKSGK